jgi:hypothetical protein
MICALSVNATNQEAIAAKGGIEAVVLAMGTHESSVVVQVSCLMALLNLAESAQNQVVFSAKGGIEAVVGAMRARPQSLSRQERLLEARMQDFGCWILGSLAIKAENHVAIAAKGGVEAVVRAMGAHGSSALTAGLGCQALGRLAENAENAIAAKGGIEAVVGAMLAHRWDATVQKRGCAALAKLAVNLAAIAATGGIKALVQAMRSHGSSAEVQVLACGALGRIARSDVRLHSQIKDAGVIPLVEKALSSFPENGKLQGLGKGLLEQLGM